jgi:hypothetical protein
MVVMKRRGQDRFPHRKIEPLEVRRKRRAEEATLAVKEYLRAQEAARARMAALREERLAREDAQSEMKSFDA